jgi:DNA repair protein RecN (Recombination protein N)
LESAYIEVKDIVAELNHASHAAPGANPTRQQALEERLNLIYRLEKKHLCEADALSDLQVEMQSKMSEFESVDDRIETLRTEVTALQQQLSKAAEKLTYARKKAAKPIANEVAGLLMDLSMPFAQFDIVISAKNPDIQGCDAIEFLFSANKGASPKPLRQVASGGEFSRLMLTIKYVIAGRTAMPTLIFDEIDTGVSGEVAAKMGRLMKGMANRHQIITITHTAQIAAMGNLHFYVEKAHSGSKTTSKVRQLNKEERIKEIAQMISGDRITTASLDTAKELLAAN